MPTVEFITAWFLVMFPLVYSPGPANTLFAANGAAFGFRRTLPFLAGLDLAFALQSVVVGMGLGSVLQRCPSLLIIAHYMGIAYIAYLGSRFLYAAAKPAKVQAHCLSFTDGLVVTAVNPKAWIMQLMMFSQFLDSGALTSSVATLTLLLALLNFTGHVVWIAFGSLLLGSATSVLTPRHQNMLFALMLFGSIYFLV